MTKKNEPATMATSCTYVQRSGANVVSMTVAVGGREKRSLTEQSFAKI
jgi:azurin